MVISVNWKNKHTFDNQCNYLNWKVFQIIRYDSIMVRLTHALLLYDGLKIQYKLDLILIMNWLSVFDVGESYRSF